MTARDAIALPTPVSAPASKPALAASVHADAPHQLVLLGAGDAHLHLLAAMAKRPLPGVRVVLVNASANLVHPSMLAGWVAGYYKLDACSIALEPLARHGAARLLVRAATALNARQQSLTLDDGSTLAYDWLSINTAPTQSRTRTDLAMPGARTHGLFLHPMDTFATLWPRVVELSNSRALRVAVVATGGAGIEMASAVRRGLPNAAVTLVCSASTWSGLGAVAPRVLAALRHAGVTVLQEEVLSIDAEKVCLSSGASLACDVPLLATQEQPQSWLAQSALALDANGFLAVNSYLQSISHPNVFCTDPHTRGAGNVLFNNLRGAMAYAPLQTHTPPRSSPLNFLTCGSRYAVASWGQHNVHGHWVWWVKHAIDKRYVAKYQGGAP